MLLIAIISSVSCNDISYKKGEPTICLIRSSDSNELSQMYPIIEMEILGLEFNPDAFFFISATSMWGRRIFLITKCNEFTYKQIVLIPDEPGGVATIAITGKTYIRYFTSKEISEISDWDHLSLRLYDIIRGDPEQLYVYNDDNDSHEIYYNYAGSEELIGYYDSIPIGILEIIDSITGLESNVLHCKDICDKYFESKSEK